MQTKKSKIKPVSVIKVQQSKIVISDGIKTKLLKLAEELDAGRK
jgi:hypothetical protein